MTIGQLARRSGVPVKRLRAYEDAGLLYTAGRSPAGYRLFDEDALWCLEVVARLRGLGLTLAEIRDLAAVYRQQTAEPIGPRLAEQLRAVRRRIDARLAELHLLEQHLDAFEAQHAAELAGQDDFRAHDPHQSRRPA